MKKVSQEIDDLLLDYLADKLQGEKLEKVKKGLSTSESLRERLEAFKLIEHSLQESRLMNPNENFTQRVMNNLHRVPSTSILTPKNGLMLLLGILVAAGIGVVLVDAGLYNSLNGILALNQIEAPMGLKTPSLPSIPLNGKWLVNSIIALNIGLAFLILDRTILKPLFNKRSRIQF